MVISIILLVIQEFWQAIALKKQYFKELENWFELMILAFAISTLILKHEMDNLKVVAALGVCFSWLDLIFLLGRYPSLGGSFSIMYYTATKRIIKTVLGFFVLVLGFSFAFFVIYFGNDSDLTLSKLPHAALKVFVMILGEIEFDDLLESKSGSGDLTTGFTMVLLLCLIFFGSIVMMNLIVAIIIMDIEWLNKMSKEQILLNQAHHAVQIHSIFKLLPSSMQSYGQEKSPPRNGQQLEFCVHSICNCERPSLPRETKEEVLSILNKRQILNIEQ